jgi:hypothetical protein
LLQALVLYVSFLGAAWFKEGAFLREQWGLLRLAIPAGMAMLGLILEGAYSTPGRRSSISPRSRARSRVGACIAGRVLGWQSSSRRPTLDHGLWMRYGLTGVFRRPDVVSAGR